MIILVNGFCQSYSSAHDGRLFIDPDLLKSVQISKGPNSSLCGAGVLRGIIALTAVDAADFS